MYVRESHHQTWCFFDHSYVRERIPAQHYKKPKETIPEFAVFFSAGRRAERITAAGSCTKRKYAGHTTSACATAEQKSKKLNAEVVQTMSCATSIRPQRISFEGNLLAFPQFTSLGSTLVYLLSDDVSCIEEISLDAQAEIALFVGKSSKLEDSSRIIGKVQVARFFLDTQARAFLRNQLSRHLGEPTISVLMFRFCERKARNR